MAPAGVRSDQGVIGLSAGVAGQGLGRKVTSLLVDRLAALLGHFSVSARTFQTGPLCGVNELGGSLGYGQLHLLKSGKAEVWHSNTRAHCLDGPALLFYPRPIAHRFVTDQEHGAEFVCAHIELEGGAANPLANALPACVCLPLSQMPDSLPVLMLLFAEAGELPTVGVRPCSTDCSRCCSSNCSGS
ncbi:cupin domain-containing protein [Pseudomonas sp. R-28-1W-6]|uniref:cupin domain-containing protein n=1 Tax=Pseudomonas sp. R-28-1W-6 TaxID=2650101 RepID=UPI003556D097